jgi:hypothetical protein
MKNVAPTKRLKALQESADAQYEIYKRSHELKLWVERRTFAAVHKTVIVKSITKDRLADS